MHRPTFLRLKIASAERTWLTLVGLTAASAVFAETGHAGWPLALVVAGLIAVKGRLVIDHYMEMPQARRGLRWALYAFASLVPMLVLLSHGSSDTLRRLTTLN